MKLGERHLEALSRADRGDFEQRMLKHLHSGFAEECESSSDDELRGLIRAGVELAPKHGINVPFDVARLIEYLVCYGEDCATRRRTRWIGEILGRADLDGTAKMDTLDAEDAHRHRRA
ncbi:MAG: hypothetical protein ACYS7M_04575 [Planctomycetota bacterium]|jgi:hypothetical protein